MTPAQSAASKARRSGETLPADVTAHPGREISRRSPTDSLSLLIGQNRGSSPRPDQSLGRGAGLPGASKPWGAFHAAPTGSPVRPAVTETRARGCGFGAKGRGDQRRGAPGPGEVRARVPGRVSNAGRPAPPCETGDAARGSEDASLRQDLEEPWTLIRASRKRGRKNRAGEGPPEQSGL